MRETVIIYEDAVHRAILLKMLLHVGFDMCFLRDVGSKRGKANIDSNITRYSEAASHKNILILRDLDNDEACAPQLLRRLSVDNPIQGFGLSIAVREAEAWLMADNQHFCNRFRVNSSSLHLYNAEEQSRPKEFMLRIINHGRLSKSNKRLIIKTNANGRIGQSEQYNETIVKFIEEDWDIESAAQNADSLRRALIRVRNVISTQ